MSMMRKKSIALLLIMLLGSMAVANAAQGIIACPPKKCCCTPNPHAAMGHSGAMGPMDHSLPMEKPRDCAPKAKAPCCNLKSDVQPIKLAVTTATSSHTFRFVAAHFAADIHMETPLAQPHINAYSYDGWPKIPKVPIFLQTLSILC